MHQKVTSLYSEGWWDSTTTTTTTTTAAQGAAGCVQPAAFLLLLLFCRLLWWKTIYFQLFKLTECFCLVDLIQLKANAGNPQCHRKSSRVWFKDDFLFCSWISGDSSLESSFDQFCQWAIRGDLLHQIRSFFEHCSKSLWPPPPFVLNIMLQFFFDGFLKKRVNVCRDKIRQNNA